jgi:hypothetical protein
VSDADIDCRPRFEFLADSADADNAAGTARWTYTTVRSGEPVEVIVRQRFDSFAAAHAMNELIRVAFEAGGVRGQIRVRDAVLDALRTYC